MSRSTPTLGIALALAVAACAGSSRQDVSPAHTLPTSSVTTPSPPASGLPPVHRWSGTIVSRTHHDLYVGGRCQSDWRTTLRFRQRADVVEGRGTAERTTLGDPCPFPVAQLQIRRFQIQVTGRLDGPHLSLRLEATSFLPSAGAADLGGFLATTLATALRLHVRSAAVSERVELQTTDQDRGSFVSTNVVHLRCRAC